MHAKIQGVADFERVDPLLNRTFGAVIQAKQAKRLDDTHLQSPKATSHCFDIYVPECIYFWGEMFAETYGETPFEERYDKLQDNRYHKWEWVSGLEMSFMMLERYDHTQDETFLKETTIPFASERLVETTGGVRTRFSWPIWGSLMKHVKIW